VLEQDGINGNLTTEQCATLPGFIGDTCGCVAKGAPAADSISSPFSGRVRVVKDHLLAHGIENYKEDIATKKGLITHRSSGRVPSK
jgi:hypothetical protein